jgi:hypothetical protein
MVFNRTLAPGSELQILGRIRGDELAFNLAVPVG